MERMFLMQEKPKDDRYREIIDGCDHAETQKEKLTWTVAALKMIVNNHLPHIEYEIRQTRRVNIVSAILILLAILFQSQISLTSLIEWFMRLI